MAGRRIAWLAFPAKSKSRRLLAAAKGLLFTAQQRFATASSFAGSRRTCTCHNRRQRESRPAPKCRSELFERHLVSVPSSSGRRSRPGTFHHSPIARSSFQFPLLRGNVRDNSNISEAIRAESNRAWDKAVVATSVSPVTLSLAAIPHSVAHSHTRPRSTFFHLNSEN